MIILFSIIILLSILAFYNGLITREYNIYSEKINSEITITLITDLHSHIYGKEQADIREKIKKTNPDIILLGGDIADDVVPIDGTKKFLAAICDIAPVYYVSGNHEFWSNDIDNIKDVIRSYGVIVLENHYEQIVIRDNKIIIGGVDDPDSYRNEYIKKELEYMKEKFKNNLTYTDWDRDMESIFENLKNESSYKILLSHRPEKIELYKK